MSGEIHCLDELAADLDASIGRLERIVGALDGARPVVVGSNMAAMRRIWFARDRLADVLIAVGNVPAFMVDEVRAMVATRLAEDDQGDGDTPGDEPRPRADGHR